MDINKKKIHFFFSYSHSDKEIVDKIKIALESQSIFKCFMAHKDIQITYSWRNAILKNLSECDYLIAFISESFNQSIWCNQEIGFFFNGKEKHILPLIIDTGAKPEGLLSETQGKSLICTEIDHSEFNTYVLNLLNIFLKTVLSSEDYFKYSCTTLYNSRSFRQAEENLSPIMELLNNKDNVKSETISIFFSSCLNKAPNSINQVLNANGAIKNIISIALMYEDIFFHFFEKLSYNDQKEYINFFERNDTDEKFIEKLREYSVPF